jgi:hypothetical protein
MERPDDLPLRTGEDGGTVGEAAPADLFTPPFVRQHTDASTLAGFLGASPLAGDGDASREEFDAYVAAHSEFGSWEEMERAAEVALLEREIGLL